MSIALTDNERALFALLLHVNEAAALGLVLRVAGGWVRDKLMGLESSDIDIVVDKGSPFTYAEALKEIVEKETGKKLSLRLLKGNPEMSKCVQVAHTYLMKSEVDLTSFHKYPYSSGEEAEITIEEDAFERDLTINALYYNLSTGAVEDVTGQGLEDIKNKRLRMMSSNPHEKIMNNPLIPYRVLRFAATLPTFKLDPELVTLAQNPEIQERMRLNLTYERIYQQFDYIARKADFAYFADMLEKMHLLYPYLITNLEELTCQRTHKNMYWECTRMKEYEGIVLRALRQMRGRTGSLSDEQKVAAMCYAFVLPTMGVLTPAKPSVTRVDKHALYRLLKRSMALTNVVSKLNTICCTIRGMLLGVDSLFETGSPYIGLSRAYASELIHTYDALNHVSLAMLFRSLVVELSTDAEKETWFDVIYLCLDVGWEKPISAKIKEMMSVYKSAADLATIKPTGIKVNEIARRLGVENPSEYGKVRRLMEIHMLSDPERIKENSVFTEDVVAKMALA